MRVRPLRYLVRVAKLDLPRLYREARAGENLPDAVFAPPDFLFRV